MYYLNLKGSNPHNVVKATFDALLQMRSAYTVANKEEFL
jgi:ribosomal protein S5